MRKVNFSPRTKFKLCYDGILRPFKGRRTVAEEERDFWKRVKIGKPDECWPWQGGEHTKGRGYGVVWARNARWKAHRYAFAISVRPIKDGELICHECDNPPCCNPKHLFAGTNKDNSDDCIKKGRAKKQRGENRYNAVLTDGDVRKIRRLYQPRKYSTYRLSKEFGIRQSMVWAIIHRKRWKHVK